MPRPGSTIVDPDLYGHIGRTGHWPHSGRIERRQQTGQSPSGEPIVALTTVHEVPACRVTDTMGLGQRKGQTELRKADGTIVVATHAVDIAGAVPGVRETDRFFWAERGQSFDIIGFANASTDDRTRLYIQRAA